MSQAGPTSVEDVLGVPLSVPKGGTGDVAFTPYAVITGGTTSTGALQNVVSVGTLGQVLTSQGAGALPQFTTISSGVSSVSGTANRITSTGGANPVIDISAAYVGQSSITTLGTITTGVWNGTAVDATHGGTAQTTYATGDILYASATNTLSKLAAGSNTQILTLAAGIPSWAAPATNGTVTGPGSSTDRAIATWNSTTGKILFDNSTTKIDSTGRMTNSAQPSVLAIVNASVSNVTGNATLYTMIPNTAIINRGSNFDTTTGTFTAPVTGVYMVSAQAILGNVGIVASTFEIYITATSRQFKGGGTGPINSASTNTRYISINGLVDMTASDTFTIQVLVSGQGADTVTVVGDASRPFSYVSCYLVA